MSATVNLNENDTVVANLSATNVDKNTKLQNVDINNTPLNDGSNGGSSKNWVKFDEENNAIDHKKDEYEDLSLDYSNDDNGNKEITQSQTTLSTSAPIQPKLSPPPPTARRSHARTSPIPSTAQQITQTSPTSVPRTPLPDETPAVLTTESVHVNLNSSASTPNQKQTLFSNGQTNASSSTATLSTTPQPPKPKSTSISIPPSASVTTSEATMRTIELSTGRIREGFASGDVIVTLLPVNTKWPWVTPAVFRPELVPEELMAQGLTLTVEEYVNAMETLVNDYRFTAYNICYKRILVCWILFAFCVLLSLLFSGLQGIALFSLGVGWLFLNAAAIFFCMWVKLRLSRGLEKCLARVNKQLMRHKILIVLDDRGRISCHKVNLCFIYYDPTQCIAYLNEFIERCEQNGANIQAGWESKLDLEVNDIVIQGSNPMRLSRKQERAMSLYLRYASRWGNEVVRGLRDVTSTEPARHCAKAMCTCQYIEEHLSCKPRGKWKFLSVVYWVLASERYD